MAKKESKKSQPSQKWKKYAVDGGKVKRTGRTCPKCGDGVFLAVHKDRASCGKCGYTESKSKAEKAPSKEQSGGEESSSENE